MKILLALLAAMTLASCGGGGGGSFSPADPSISNAPLIRYQGSWRASHFSSVGPIPPATLTLRPLSGQTAIGSNTVARVEVQLGQAAPVILTAANSTDATGRPQYVFNFGQLAEVPNCSNSLPNLQVGITVVDVTGFSFTKKIATCATGADMDFGAFSDYGTTSARFSYSSTAPITAFATRRSPAGYVDTLVPTSQASFDATLPSADADALQLFASPNPPLPSGTRVTSRIDGGGGAFAESTIVAAANALQPLVLLDCCGPKTALDSNVAVELRIRDILAAQGATYTYRFLITDPATGTVVGSQTGTTFGDAAFQLQVKRGNAIEMDVTPNAAGVNVEATARLHPFGSGGFNAMALSNEVGAPARFKVFCCSP